MPKQYLEFFDLDTFIVCLIAVGNLVDINLPELAAFFFDPKTVLSYADDLLRLAISGFSVLILYKKYKKLK